MLEANLKPVTELPHSRRAPTFPSNQLRLPHALRMSEGGKRCSQPLEVLTLSLARSGVTQTDKKLRDAGRIGSHPLKTAEGGAASFRVTSRKIKGESGAAPCQRSGTRPSQTPRRTGHPRVEWLDAAGKVQRSFGPKNGPQDDKCCFGG
jgi:hypothetical protein